MYQQRLLLGALLVTMMMITGPTHVIAATGVRQRTFSILWFSDIQLDAFYGTPKAAGGTSSTVASQKGAEDSDALLSSNSLFQGEDGKQPKCSQMGGHVYGTPGCYTPASLVRYAAAIEAGRSVGRHDAILVSGSFSPPDLAREDLLDTINLTMRSIQSIWGPLSYPYVVNIGPNDLYPNNFFNTSAASLEEASDYVLKNISDVFAEVGGVFGPPSPTPSHDDDDNVITNPMQESFAKGGFYRKDMPLDPVTFLSLNTVLFSRKLEPYPPTKEDHQGSRSGGGNENDDAGSDAQLTTTEPSHHNTTDVPPIPNITAAPPTSPPPPPLPPADNKQGNGTDPAGQLEWLQEQLEEMRNSNRWVIIVGNIPPGIDFAVNKFYDDGSSIATKNYDTFYEEFMLDEYATIVSNYSKIITTQLFSHNDGHAHFRLMNGMVAYCAPSLSPQTFTEPTYSTFDIDVFSGSVKSWKMHSLNLNNLSWTEVNTTNDILQANHATYDTISLFYKWLPRMKDRFDYFLERMWNSNSNMAAIDGVVSRVEEHSNSGRRSSVEKLVAEPLFSNGFMGSLQERLAMTCAFSYLTTSSSGYKQCMGTCAPLFYVQQQDSHWSPIAFVESRPFWLLTRVLQVPFLIGVIAMIFIGKRRKELRRQAELKRQAIIKTSRQKSSKDEANGVAPKKPSSTNATVASTTRRHPPSPKLHSPPDTMASQPEEILRRQGSSGISLGQVVSGRDGENVPPPEIGDDDDVAFYLPRAGDDDDDVSVMSRQFTAASASSWKDERLVEERRDPAGTNDGDEEQESTTGLVSIQQDDGDSTTVGHSAVDYGSGSVDVLRSETRRNCNFSPSGDASVTSPLIDTASSSSNSQQLSPTLTDSDFNASATGRSLTRKQTKALNDVVEEEKNEKIDALQGAAHMVVLVTLTSLSLWIVKKVLSFQLYDMSDTMSCYYKAIAFFSSFCRPVLLFILVVQAVSVSLYPEFHLKGHIDLKKSTSKCCSRRNIASKLVLFFGRFPAYSRIWLVACVVWGLWDTLDAVTTTDVYSQSWLLKVDIVMVAMSLMLLYFVGSYHATSHYSTNEAIVEMKEFVVKVNGLFQMLDTAAVAVSTASSFERMTRRDELLQRLESVCVEMVEVEEKLRPSKKPDTTETVATKDGKVATSKSPKPPTTTRRIAKLKDVDALSETESQSLVQALDEYTTSMEPSLKELHGVNEHCKKKSRLAWSMTKEALPALCGRMKAERHMLLLCGALRKEILLSIQRNRSREGNEENAREKETGAMVPEVESQRSDSRRQKKAKKLLQDILRVGRHILPSLSSNAEVEIAEASRVKLGETFKHVASVVVSSALAGASSALSVYSTTLMATIISSVTNSGFDAIDELSVLILKYDLVKALLLVVAGEVLMTISETQLRIYCLSIVPTASQLTTVFIYLYLQRDGRSLGALLGLGISCITIFTMLGSVQYFFLMSQSKRSAAAAAVSGNAEDGDESPFSSLDASPKQQTHGLLWNNSPHHQRFKQKTHATTGSAPHPELPSFNHAVLNIVAKALLVLTSLLLVIVGAIIVLESPQYLGNPNLICYTAVGIQVLLCVVLFGPVWLRRITGKNFSNIVIGATDNASLVLLPDNADLVCRLIAILMWFVMIRYWLTSNGSQNGADLSAMTAIALAQRRVDPLPIYLRELFGEATEKLDVVPSSTTRNAESPSPDVVVKEADDVVV